MVGRGSICTALRRRNSDGGGRGVLYEQAGKVKA